MPAAPGPADQEFDELGVRMPKARTKRKKHKHKTDGALDGRSHARPASSICHRTTLPAPAFALPLAGAALSPIRERSVSDTDDSDESHTRSPPARSAPPPQPASPAPVSGNPFAFTRSPTRRTLSEFVPTFTEKPGLRTKHVQVKLSVIRDNRTSVEKFLRDAKRHIEAHRLSEFEGYHLAMFNMSPSMASVFRLTYPPDGSHKFSSVAHWLWKRYRVEPQFPTFFRQVMLKFRAPPTALPTAVTTTWKDILRMTHAHFRDDVSNGVHETLEHEWPSDKRLLAIFHRGLPKDVREEIVRFSNERPTSLDAYYDALSTLEAKWTDHHGKYRLPNWPQSASAVDWPSAQFVTARQRLAHKDRPKPQSDTRRAPNQSPRGPQQRPRRGNGGNSTRGRNAQRGRNKRRSQSQPRDQRNNRPSSRQQRQPGPPQQQQQRQGDRQPGRTQPKGDPSQPSRPQRPQAKNDRGSRQDKRRST